MCYGNVFYFSRLYDKSSYVISEANENENREENAAIKIQASYRGYKTRSNLKNDLATQLTGERSDEKEEGVNEEKD